MKLTEHHIEQIRLRSFAGENEHDLADEFKISRPYMSRIVTGCARSDAPGPIRKPICQKKLTDKQIDMAVTMYNTGALNVKGLSRKYGVDHTTLRDAILRRIKKGRP